LAVLNATTETIGSRARLYAGPKFARYEGRWRRVDDLLSVKREGDAYVIRLADDWISFRPSATDAAALALATKHEVVTATHFGPALTPAACPDSLTFDVDFSKGVSVVAGGLEFPSVEGLRCVVWSKPSSGTLNPKT